MNTYQIFLRRTKQDYVAGSLGKSLIIQGDKLELNGGYVTIKKKSAVVFTLSPGLWEIACLSGSMTVEKTT